MMGDVHFKNHRMNLTVLLEYFDTSIHSIGEVDGPSLMVLS